MWHASTHPLGNLFFMLHMLGTKGSSEQLHRARCMGVCNPPAGAPGEFDGAQHARRPFAAALTRCVLYVGAGARAKPRADGGAVPVAGGAAAGGGGRGEGRRISFATPAA